MGGGGLGSAVESRIKAVQFSEWIRKSELVCLKQKVG